MRHLVATLFAALAWWVAPPVAGTLRAQSEDLVLLDVVVTDRLGKAVSGLTRDDFTVKEDGRTVDIKTFSAVNGEVDDVPRTLILMLDDFAMPRDATSVVQIIARNIIDTASPKDEIAVVRLSKPDDEAFGDRILARQRIDEYRGSSEPYVDPYAPQEMLRRFAAVTEQLEIYESKRKLAVCIGAPIICNTTEPSPGSRRHWSLWVAALSGAARTNVAAYAVVPSRVRFRGGGLPEFTGGTLFAGAADFRATLDRIRQDASQYYLLGYWPESSAKDLHRIEVKLARKGLRVSVRKRRGA